MKQTPVRLLIAFLAGWVGGLATLAVVSAQAPHPPEPANSLPLVIGGRAFRIGMPRQEAMALITDCCRTSGSNPDAFFLMPKTGNFDIIGSIAFRADRVSELSASLKSTSERDSSDLVLTLFRAILNGRDLAAETVSLRAFAREAINGTSRNIVITYPNGRVLVLSQLAGDKGTIGVNLEEER